MASGTWKPAIEIVRIAAEERADLIVMGTLGHGLIGSVSDAVIGRHVRPVLVVRPAPAAALV